ncbi:MAG: DUF4832 domain-containing protein [Planctomycetota bacterium]
MLLRAVSLVLVLGLTVATAGAQQRQVVTYNADPTAFVNPERGFMFSNLPDFATNSTRPLDPTVLAGLRDQNITIVSQVFVMTDYLERDFDEAFFDQVREVFDAARDNGLKTSLRFTYNWNQSVSSADASLTQGTRHLEQLRPIFEANEDVLGFVELGFIGRFGEWNGSSNGHVVPNTVDLAQSGVDYTQAILDNVPDSRMVSVRYAKQFEDFFGAYEPVSAAEAYTGTDRSRLAVIDHAIAFDGESSVGTWDPDLPDRAIEQAFVAAHSEYVIAGGEPFANSAYFQDNILTDAERFHFAVLSANQNDAVNSGLYDELRASGKYDELDRRLGYRYRMVELDAPAQVQVDGIAELTLSVSNDGFARPFNERVMELVLRDLDDGTDHRVALDTEADLRLLLPGGGETATLQLDFALDGIAAGEYALLLNLPDPSASLADDPRYSIRLANLGVWEPATGFNDLGVTVTVVPEPAVLGWIGGMFTLSRRRSR